MDTQQTNERPSPAFSGDRAHDDLVQDALRGGTGWTRRIPEPYDREKILRMWLAMQREINRLQAIASHVQPAKQDDKPTR